jgi:hypothetical protein
MISIFKPTTPGPVWRVMPRAAGWYFFAADIEDWHASNVVAVELLEHPCGRVEFRTNLSGHKTITPGMGWWCGPFRPVCPFKPSGELKDGLHPRDTPRCPRC